MWVRGLCVLFGEVFAMDGLLSYFWSIFASIFRNQSSHVDLIVHFTWSSQAYAKSNTVRSVVRTELLRMVLSVVIDHVI